MRQRSAFVASTVAGLGLIATNPQTAVALKLATATIPIAFVAVA